MPILLRDNFPLSHVIFSGIESQLVIPGPEFKKPVKGLSTSFRNMTVPAEQKALVVQEQQKLKLEKIPVPKLSKDDEILVKVGRPRKHQI